MRAFVTGATGFLGSALVERLVRQRSQVVSLVRDRQAFQSAGIDGVPAMPGTLCFGDLSDVRNLERILAEYRIDTVFHLASQTEVCVGMDDPLGTFEANVRGTWNVMEACRRHGNVRLVVASSDKAYGRTPPPYVEGMPLTPDRPYETSKACADLIAQTYASSYKMNVAVTRCVNLYGPQCGTLTTLVPTTIKRILSGQPPILRNGGKMRRDWLYIQDAVSAYLSLANSQYVGPMNFGSGVGIPTYEVVRIICDLLGFRGDPIQVDDVHGEIPDQWADASLAAKELGWKPLWDLRDGLAQTVEWYRGHVYAG